MSDIEKGEIRNSRMKWKTFLTIASCLCLLAAVCGVMRADRSMRYIIDKQGFEYLSVLYYNGYSYMDISSGNEGIKPGKYLGTVEIDLTDVNCNPKGTRIGATILKPGEDVYEWEGYPPEFRICGVTSGVIRGFERRSTSGMEEKPVSAYFPDLSNVKKISIQDYNYAEHGSVDQQEDIARIMGAFIHGATFIDAKSNGVMGNKDLMRLFVTLLDGTKTEIILFNSSQGHWLDSIRLPEGFMDLVRSYIFYEADDEYMNYGRDFADYNNNYYDDQNPIKYSMWPMWVEYQTLYTGSIAPTKFCYPLAEHAAGCIRIENTDIWYLTTDGAVAHIVFHCPYYQGDLMNAIQSGEDLSEYVLTREILYKGPFTTLQVRSGVIWTLDPAGSLARNGEQIAEKVTCFALDGDGMSYGRRDGLFRWPEKGRSVRKLAEGNVISIAPNRSFLYYATMNDEIHRIRVDGALDTQIELGDSLYIRSVQYFSYDALDALCITAVNGEPYLWFSNDALFPLGENEVEKVEINHRLLYLWLKDGSMKMARFRYEPDAKRLKYQEQWIPAIELKP